MAELYLTAAVLPSLTTVAVRNELSVRFTSVLPTVSVRSFANSIRYSPFDGVVSNSIIYSPVFSPEVTPETFIGEPFLAFTVTLSLSKFGITVPNPIAESRKSTLIFLSSVLSTADTAMIFESFTTPFG